ncbi:hypothetical protein Moror_15627 [Moniliophthora roreri MCA 2997]|uniref:Uncharacterized protein n=1 Tax=Moniliophthora roreri (strain MCA 2997) TaxID=1381753 RepID=V2W9B4_MONRO|nr:hypothetical protein Moror_15627 [Moniliophthora roreri MCA 2997]
MSPVFCTRHLSEYSITWTQLRLDVVGNEEFDIWSAREISTDLNALTFQRHHKCPRWWRQNLKVTPAVSYRNAPSRDASYASVPITFP